MTVDVAAARDFVTTHARLLDRRRLQQAAGRADAAAVLAALDAYRNDDGGYGWGLEPELRTPGSQPLHALHAFEVLEECGPTSGSRAVELCEWLATIAFDDGGLPFVLPIAETAGCAPWFTDADPTTPSFHGTAAVVGAALRMARRDSVVASHPWLARAVDWCLDAIAALERPHAYETMFALRLLDALAPDDPLAADDLARVAATLPPSGALPVEGGIEGEMLRPLDYSPDPGTPLRAQLDPAIVEADLDRLAGLQQADGGWAVDFASFSPAAALEWRGIATVRALTVLHANSRVGLGHVR
ncbi:MAG TPA: hypothetical protein VHF47_02110 [Acidimicrobiales bacterium]|nr:hypothetical protein [Acidimicrobiales bacterium]